MEKLKIKKSRAQLENLMDVLVWNHETELMDQKGKKYIYIEKNNNDNNSDCVYEKINGNNNNNNKVKLIPNKIYLAKLDRRKNKRTRNNMDGIWLWKNHDNIDVILNEEIKNNIKYIGILVIKNTNENNNNNKCWKAICNHVFDYDSIKQWITSPNFNGCPICRAGKEYTIVTDIITNNYQEEEIELISEEILNQALMEAILEKDIERIKYLIEEENINVNAIIGDNEITPLMIASSISRVENSDNTNKIIIQYLVQRGANVNAQDRYGNTSLMIASIYGSLNIVKYLVEYAGADINILNENQETALEIAYKYGNESIAKYFENKYKF